MHRRGAIAPVALLVLACVLLAGSGCQSNPFAANASHQLRQDALAMSRQNQELQVRATALDQDNQEMSRLLAQSEQEKQLLEDHLAAVREQLSGVNEQLAELRSDKQATDERVKTLTASLRRRVGVEIKPNNSLLQTLPQIDVPGVTVRRDGDVIRVYLPGGQLFGRGEARLLNTAPALLQSVADEVVAAYPEQMIGVEGHTDSGPLTGGQFRSQHEMSVVRAMAVYNFFVTQGALRPDQLFVTGHGANHPVASNGSDIGKQQNRRVELVIYPQRAGR